MLLGINRFMTGQIWLGALKLAIFLALAILFIVITSATLDAVANAATNEDLQNAIRLIGVNSFIIGILDVVITIWWFVDLFITGNAVRKAKFSHRRASLNNTLSCGINLPNPCLDKKCAVFIGYLYISF